ncbi:hypothetical protein R3I94_002520 [Phoxinus phoxinus]
MSVEKICRIFQVDGSSLYITDDANTRNISRAIWTFCTPILYIAVITRSTGIKNKVSYKVSYKVSFLQAEPYPLLLFLLPSCAARTYCFFFHRNTTTFPWTPRATGLFTARSFQRSVHVAEIINDKLSTSRTVVIRFLEADATVERITAKVKDALGCDEPITLTDSQGNEIMDSHLDSHGTRSSQYWKQNSRKIYAIYEYDFLEFQNGRRAKASRRAEDSLSAQEVIGKINQIKQAAEGLQDITTTIKQLSELAKSKTTTVMPDACLHTLKDAFTCLICKALMEEPMFSTCCESLVGCQTCVEQWRLTADHCLKCRAEEFDSPG